MYRGRIPLCYSLGASYDTMGVRLPMVWHPLLPSMVSIMTVKMADDAVRPLPEHRVKSGCSLREPASLRPRRPRSVVYFMGIFGDTALGAGR